jgi:hypothetical protein
VATSVCRRALIPGAYAKTYQQKPRRRFPPVVQVATEGSRKSLPYPHSLVFVPAWLTECLARALINRRFQPQQVHSTQRVKSYIDDNVCAGIRTVLQPVSLRAYPREIFAIDGVFQTSCT